MLQMLKNFTIASFTISDWFQNAKNNINFFRSQLQKSVSCVVLPSDTVVSEKSIELSIACNWVQIKSNIGSYTNLQCIFQGTHTIRICFSYFEEKAFNEGSACQKFCVAAKVCA